MRNQSPVTRAEHAPEKCRVQVHTRRRKKRRDLDLEASKATKMDASDDENGVCSSAYCSSAAFVQSQPDSASYATAQSATLA